MRARRAAPHENHERWLVSYADFITLLFAFFVVMFAASQVDKKRVERIAKMYGAHLQGDEAVQTLAAEWAREDMADEGENVELPIGQALEQEMGPIRDSLEERLAEPLADGRVALDLQPRGLVISLREAAVFDAGSEAFHAEAERLLTDIGEAVQGLERQPLRLEGHTDDVPIRSTRFPSNWELSTARAVAVLELLSTRFGIPAERVSVAGYGEFRPIADNRTAKGRAANRRVDIVILSESAAAMAPKQMAQNDGSAEAVTPDSPPPASPEPPAVLEPAERP